MGKEDITFLEEQINRFFRNNKETNLTYEDILKIHLENPKMLYIVDPDGNIVSYELKPSENHYIGYIDYGRKLLDSKNEIISTIKHLFDIDYNRAKTAGVIASKKIAALLGNNGYYALQSFIDPDHLKHHYLSNISNNLSETQINKIENLHQELGLFDYDITEKIDNFIACNKDLTDQKIR